jgi:hypothetical protein
MEEFEFNNFIYQHSRNPEGSILNIVHNHSTPQHLFKYYSLSENSVKCLTQNYFYAPHPIELNDILDGSLFLLTSSGPLKFEHYQSFFKDLITNENLKDFYEKDIKNNSVWFLDFYWQKYTNKLGVISLTSKENNLLMWPHYTNECGFQLKFKTEKLGRSIIQNLPGTYFGLYPMNYCKDLIQINVQKTNSPFIPLLYLATVKSDFWNYENEWRFIVSNQNMGVPLNKSSMDPRKGLPTLEKSRNIHYDSELIEEITFGSRFITAQDFEIERIRDNGVLTNKTIITVLNKDDKRCELLTELLEYCCQKLKDKIFFSSYAIKPNQKGEKCITRSKVKVKLEKIRNKTYLFERTDQINYFE